MIFAEGCDGWKVLKERSKADSHLRKWTGCGLWLFGRERLIQCGGSSCGWSRFGG
jgi:hypothetical protein